MKAAVLNAFGSPLSIESLPDPVIGTGEVIVDVVAAPVLTYTDEVLSGARKYLLTLPQAPGCGAIGRIREIGPDATKIAVGDWVMCDPTVRARDDARMPDITLQGWSSRGPGGLRLQAHFRQGPFAERIMVPTENAIPIGSLDGASPTEVGQWCSMNTLLVPYGGWLATNLRAGEIALVSGATGQFGSAAVAVALAMGARCVVAPGRNATMLAELSRRFGDRVKPVPLSGDEDEDRQRMTRAAPGPIDCVLDILPPTASPRAARAALMTVRPYGRVVLMGGVGMLGGEPFELPYPWIMRSCVTLHGVWMYPHEAVTGIVGLIRSGLLKTSDFEVTTFDLEHANEAVAHAAQHGGAFRTTVIAP